MLEKIDHIGIAVKSLEEAMKFYKSIGLQVGHIEEVPSQKVKVAMFDIGGVHIELLEPTSEDSPIAKFLEKNREGMHHISYRVKDIRKALAKLESEGVALIDKEPKMGANNMLVAFVHPKSVSGVLTELSEPAS